MTKHQMARRIKNLERHVEDLETELQSVTGRILPIGAPRFPDLGLAPFTWQRWTGVGDSGVLAVETTGVGPL